MSKNNLVKELLARSLGLPINGKLPDDYSEFCGLWTESEYEQFNANQRGNSRVDSEDWS
jgi:hypothetical protein